MENPNNTHGVQKKKRYVNYSENLIWKKKSALYVKILWSDKEYAYVSYHFWKSIHFSVFLILVCDRQSYHLWASGC